jgi:hypothetical protein
VYTIDNVFVTDGLIKQTGTFQSIGYSYKSLTKTEAYIIKIDGVSYGNFSGTVFLKSDTEKKGKANALKKQLENYIKQYPFLTLNENADMMLDIHKRNDGNYDISLIEKGDSIHYQKMIKATDSLATDDWKYFMEGMKRTLRIKYFRNISDGGIFAKAVDMQLVPAKLNRGIGGEILMKPGDPFSIRVANKGTQALYFTIIDLLPNNDIKVLIPDDGDEPQDYIIRPGETRTVEGIQVDAATPRGKEFFKAIFTKVPVDLRAVLNRKKTRGSELQSFEKVVDDMFSENNTAKNTRSEISRIKVDELGIITAGFSVWY